MERILGTTDFSSNSKAGIRYALNLALTLRAALATLHVFYVLRGSSWSDRYTTIISNGIKKYPKRSFIGSYNPFFAPLISLIIVVAIWNYTIALILSKDTLLIV